MQIVTKTLLSLGVKKNTEVNEFQLILLGIDENDKSDWMALCIGKKLSDARAELFILLSNIKTKKARETIISNYKALQKFRLGQQPLDQVRLKSPIAKEEGATQEEVKIQTTTQVPVNTNVTIYCDGGCTPNPGEAGSGVAVYRAGKLCELWYGLYETMGTNNTAELGALYESLLLAQKEAQNSNVVEIKCDSMYSIDCISKWAISWEKKGWTKKSGAIKNLDVIKQAYYLYQKIKKDVKLSHIKAHTGFEGNELADRMTIFAIQEKSEEFVKYTDEINIDEILKMRAG